MKIIRAAIRILAIAFGVYVYPDLTALFEKAGQFLTIEGTNFVLKFTYMGLLWLVAAIVLTIVLPKLRKKINLLTIPCELIESLALGYIIGFVVYLF